MSRLLGQSIQEGVFGYDLVLLRCLRTVVKCCGQTVDCVLSVLIQTCINTLFDIEFGVWSRLDSLASLVDYPVTKIHAWKESLVLAAAQVKQAQAQALSNKSSPVTHLWW